MSVTWFLLSGNSHDKNDGWVYVEVTESKPGLAKVGFTLGVR